MRRNSIEKHLEQKHTHTHNRVTLKVIANTHFLNDIYRLAINLYIVRCDGIMAFHPIMHLTIRNYIWSTWNGSYSILWHLLCIDK